MIRIRFGRFGVAAFRLDEVAAVCGQQDSYPEGNAGTVVTLRSGAEIKLPGIDPDTILSKTRTE